MLMLRNVLILIAKSHFSSSVVTLYLPLGLTPMNIQDMPFMTKCTKHSLTISTYTCKQIGFICYKSNKNCLSYQNEALPVLYSVCLIIGTSILIALLSNGIRFQHLTF